MQNARTLGFYFKQGILWNETIRGSYGTSLEKAWKSEWQKMLIMLKSCRVSFELVNSLLSFISKILSILVMENICWRQSYSNNLNTYVFNSTINANDLHRSFFFQSFRHGFPYQPTAMAHDPIQRLLAIGSKCGSLRMYPF